MTSFSLSALEHKARMQRIQRLAWSLVQHPSLSQRLWAEACLHAASWLVAACFLYVLLPIKPQGWMLAATVLLALLVSCTMLYWRFRKDDWKRLHEELMLSHISDTQALTALLAFARQELTLDESAMRGWLQQAWASLGTTSKQASKGNRHEPGNHDQGT